MKKYKVLWFDDEHEGFQPIKDEAFIADVHLIGYSNAQEGIPELLKNHKDYDGVILDGLFFKNEEQSGTDIDQTAFGEVAKVLSDLKAQNKILPWFIYSGQKSFVKDKNVLVDVLKDSTFAKGKVFDKNKDEDFIELLSEIKKAADANPVRQVRVNNPEIFSVFDEGILSEEVEEQIINLFLNQHPKDKSELKAILTNIRSIQESIFIKLEGINVLPNGSHGDFKIVNNHLSGNKSYASGFKPTSPEYQTLEIENLQKWIRMTCSTYIHDLEKQHYNGYMISNYAVSSMFSGLLELLLWFKKTYKENV